jgi:hypothetical protein
MNTGTSSSALRNATLLGTALQLVMVIAGHWVEFIKLNVFAIGGMAISLAAGVVYARAARVSRGKSAANGAVAGGVCAVVGIVVSYALGDVPAAVLAFGTLGSAVAGAAGGAIAGAARTTSVAGVVAGVLLVAGAAADAQTTHESRPAIKTTDFAWLAGTWEGHVIENPGIAYVTFTTPQAGLITGVMRLVDQGKVLVVELISLVDTPAGPELRFRHFSSTLQAYESEFKQAMRLTEHAADRDVFENQEPFEAKLLSTEPRVTTFFRHGVDEFVGRSEILDAQGKRGVVEVAYRRK